MFQYAFVLTDDMLIWLTVNLSSSNSEGTLLKSFGNIHVGRYDYSEMWIPPSPSLFLLHRNAKR